MKTNELIERYVYAVTKQLPQKQRRDIEQELTSLINDMLEERCGDMVPEERDVNVVLAELGKPSELAAKYDPDGERSLIGPRYYRRYIQTLKLVLPCVALGLVVAGLVGTLVEGTEKAWYMELLTWISNIIASLFCTAAGITILFAIFERKGITLDEDDLTRLPEVPKDGQRIKKGECVAGIILCAIAMMLFLFVPQFLCFFSINGEEGIKDFLPMFSSDVMHSVWYCWVAVFGLGIASEVFGLLEGVYTRRYVITALVLNVLSAAAVVFALTRPGVVAPEFIDHVRQALNSDPEFPVKLFEHFNIFLLAVWLFALVIDTVDAVVRYFKYSRTAE